MVGTVAEKLFVWAVYPPVYLSERVGWYDGYRGEVLNGVSVFQPPASFTMLWTHFVVAFPFWLGIVLLALLVVRGGTLAFHRLKRAPIAHAGPGSNEGNARPAH